MLWWSLWRLKSKNWKTRAHAVLKLLKSKDPRAVKAILIALTDEAHKVRASADKALQEMDPILIKSEEARAAVPSLLASLMHSDAEIRINAAKALGRIGDSRAMEPLLGALNDKHSYVRESVAQSLDLLGWHPSDSSQQAQYLVACQKWHELVQLGQGVVELLIATLKDDNLSVVWGVINALRQIGDARAIEPLKAKLDDVNISIAQMDISDRFYYRESFAAKRNIREAVMETLGELGENFTIRVSNSPRGRSLQRLLDHLKRHFARGFFGYHDLPDGLRSSFRPRGHKSEEDIAS
jgi:HEAT repeat protein